MLRTVPRNFRKRISLRLTTGECFVVTEYSWKKFLVRLENNRLTGKPKAQYSPAAEEYWDELYGMV